jgi:hypothetical protein
LQKIQKLGKIEKNPGTGPKKWENISKIFGNSTENFENFHQQNREKSRIFQADSENAPKRSKMSRKS